MKKTAGTKKDRRFYSIGEVARLLDLEPHVLRFWEKEFQPHIRPRRIAGRRFYSPEQVEIFRHIKHLLHEEGYTIAGAKKRLSQEGHLSRLLREIREELLAIYRLLEK